MDLALVPLIYQRVARVSPHLTHTERCAFIAECGNVSFDVVHELTVETDIDANEVLWVT